MISHNARAACVFHLIFLLGLTQVRAALGTISSYSLEFKEDMCFHKFTLKKVRKDKETKYFIIRNLV
jgi:hypothetical protein